MACEGERRGYARSINLPFPSDYPLACEHATMTITRGKGRGTRGTTGKWAKRGVRKDATRFRKAGFARAKWRRGETGRAAEGTEGSSEGCIVLPAEPHRSLSVTLLARASVCARVTLADNANVGERVPRPLELRGRRFILGTQWSRDVEGVALAQIGLRVLRETLHLLTEVFFVTLMRKKKEEGWCVFLPPR